MESLLDTRLSAADIFSDPIIGDRVPLSDAALAVGWSWERARRALFVGRLTGVRIAGKYYVDRMSVDRLKRELLAERGAHS